MGGKIIPIIRLTSAKVLVEAEAELGKSPALYGDRERIQQYAVSRMLVWSITGSTTTAD